ncbi:MAG: hypothetical protein A2901_04825 [Elusimicrobia bacterium RIFCSPLOWO2_01_FULL_54_10]|nr:MAG: hypothetical protein A2901_04825 [Elusimicrobia bacterium RIFCSPLOWO2_01_FULL_54_10]
MKNYLLTALLIFSVLPLAGCPYAYEPSAQIVPQHIKRMGLRPIRNETTFFGLEDKFTLRLQEEFTRGGQYPLVSKDTADGVIIADIKRFINEPVSYDENLVVQEKKMWVLVDIQFWDKVQNKILWQEPNLQGIHRFFVESRPGGISEEEAKEIIWDKLSRDIYRRTIEGFGSVTGELERKVPQGGPIGKEKISGQ